MTDMSMVHMTMTPMMNEVDEFETHQFATTFKPDIICLHLLTIPTVTEPVGGRSRHCFLEHLLSLTSEMSEFDASCDVSYPTIRPIIPVTVDLSSQILRTLLNGVNGRLSILSDVEVESPSFDSRSTVISSNTRLCSSLTTSLYSILRGLSATIVNPRLLS